MEEIKLNAIEQPEAMDEQNCSSQTKGETSQEIVIPVKLNK